MATKRKNSEKKNNSNDDKKFKTDEVLEFITCSVCRDIILPPIMQCTKGHLICIDCKKNVQHVLNVEDEWKILEILLLKKL